MKVLVVGAGGVGGYYGGLLAKAGEDVWFLARGAHLEVMRMRGLRVLSVHGDFTVPVRAVEEARAAGIVDLVLFCVKTYETEAAARQLPPVLGEETVVLSLQNGVRKEEDIGRFVGVERMLGGLTHIESSIKESGVIAQTGGPRRIVIGELDGSVTPRLTKVHELFVKAGINCEISRDIRTAMWEKLLFICAVGGLTSITRQPIGPVLGFEGTRRLFIQVMEEVENVARRHGIPLASDVVEKTLAFASSVGPAVKSSMQRDVEGGRRLEVDALNGTIVPLGKALGVPTPANDFIYSCLKLQDLQHGGQV